MTTYTITVQDRLQKRIVELPTGCLEWTGATDRSGYGRIMGVNQGTMFTHRLAWELANGPIPEGLHVLHHCDNPPCCQTDPTEGYPEGHLFLGTQADNNADMVAKGRARNGYEARTHCPSGHAYDEANTYIQPNGSRVCRTCNRARCLARSHRLIAARAEKSAQ